MMSVTLCLALLLHLSVAEFDRPGDPELQLTIASCRADCLDEFSPSEMSCRAVPDCFMCWESCALLHNDFDIWGPMCNATDICFPGCQRACSFHLQHGGTSLAPSTDRDWVFPPAIRSFYQPMIDCIRLEWAAPVSPGRRHLATVLYSVFLRNRLVQTEPQWEEITQTLSQNATIKRGLLNPATDIKITAVTSQGLLAELAMAFLDTSDPVHVAADEAEVLERKTSRLTPSGDSVWIPRLVSLQNSQKSVGVEATITWDSRWPERLVKYEVSWKVIDDTMEITGHLYTANSGAVLTLWPDALYSVRVRCFSRHGEERAVSESLLINTHGVGPIGAAFSTKCPECFSVQIIAGCTAGVAFFLLFAVITCFCLCYKKKKKVLRRNLAICELSKTSDTKAAGLGKSIVHECNVHSKLTTKKSSGLTKCCISQSQEDLVDDSLVHPYLSYERPFPLYRNSPLSSGPA